ncbi:MAG: relaxase/mobilization nuclease domain-containing protein [Fusobacteriaceae bacterium]|jgi:hypothetical protein|nr:relaxase/mobilization nuclease domain-containing protein [Fusobacteriaceae bacterium]MBP7025412.1 relaxase/mobilization nuclease domain-containing protein [Clostridia bacterium]MBP9596848.1 relaxase/mobilization nuclease domain-containing protein [Fusobacteriaceae bacterium]
MAIIKAVNSKSSIARAINYITKAEKTEKKLISGIDCNPETAIDEMKATKELYDKNDGRQYAHFIQSFNPKDNISPEKAHEIGKEFIEKNDKFKGHEIVLATHKDKDHIHNHFIINSVNYENGSKLHTTKHEYQEMKDISNELSKEHNLTVPEKSKEKGKITSFNQDKYQVMKKHFEGKGKSYVIETAIAVRKSKEKAISKEDFIKEMEDQGYSTNWKDTSKHITFTNKESGRKVRLANLEKTLNDSDFTKEVLIDELQRNYGERQNERERGDPEQGTNGTINPDKGIKRPNEVLSQGSDGQGFNQPADSLKRDTGDRESEQTITRSDDFDSATARELIKQSARENAKSVGELSKPDARAREIEREKVKELERSNRREHERRIEHSKSRGRSR